jgi:hypothetical protein
VTEPIPQRMRHLPLDHRGYPAPVIVMVKDGKPVFTVNDIDKIQQMVREDRCAICGGKLFRGRWLVGGCLSAMAEHGGFADGPLHDECVHYALKVCPYLAAPNWRTPIGQQQFKAHGLGGVAFHLTDTTEVADKNRPEAFVAVMTSKVEIKERPFGATLYRPKSGHVMRAEAWLNGTRLEGAALAAYRLRARAKVEQHSVLRQDVWRMLR